MALSDQERRLLDEMETALAAEDPKLASALRGTSRHWHRRRVVLAIVFFAVGMAALIGGMELHPLVSVGGFVIMLVAVVAGFSALRPPAGAAAQRPDGHTGGRSQTDFLGRAEERRRRGEDDQF